MKHKSQQATFQLKKLQFQKRAGENICAERSFPGFSVNWKVSKIRLAVGRQKFERVLEHLWMINNNYLGGRTEHAS